MHGYALFKTFTTYGGGGIINASKVGVKNVEGICS